MTTTGDKFGRVINGKCLMGHGNVPGAKEIAPIVGMGFAKFKSVQPII
jgi:hypothetical protein